MISPLFYFSDLRLRSKNKSILPSNFLLNKIILVVLDGHLKHARAGGLNWKGKKSCAIGATCSCHPEIWFRGQTLRNRLGQWQYSFTDTCIYISLYAEGHSYFAAMRLTFCDLVSRSGLVESSMNPDIFTTFYRVARWEFLVHHLFGFSFLAT